jgi:hypothetical protein
LPGVIVGMALLMNAFITKFPETPKSALLEMTEK